MNNPKMDNQTRFLAYCIEIYKEAKGLTGKEVYTLFAKYGVLDYIIDCYGALHTTGPQYTIDDIDKFIAVRNQS
ncbi:DUF3791 domain-containing protein [Viscerimonas tarda]